MLHRILVASINNVMTSSAFISHQNVFFLKSQYLPTDNVQCETISVIKFQPTHSAVDFLGNLGVFCWENPNLDSCFYFKAANSLLKQKRSTSRKIISLLGIITFILHFACHTD